jgi:hypothetical protein
MHRRFSMLGGGMTAAPSFKPPAATAAPVVQTKPQVTTKAAVSAAPQVTTKPVVSTRSLAQVTAAPVVTTKPQVTAAATAAKPSVTGKKAATITAASAQKAAAAGKRAVAAGNRLLKVAKNARHRQLAQDAIAKGKKANEASAKAVTKIGWAQIVGEGTLLADYSSGLTEQLAAQLAEDAEEAAVTAETLSAAIAEAAKYPPAASGLTSAMQAAAASGATDAASRAQSLLTEGSIIYANFQVAIDAANSPTDISQNSTDLENWLGRAAASTSSTQAAAGKGSSSTTATASTVLQQVQSTLMNVQGAQTTLSSIASMVPSMPPNLSSSLTNDANTGTQLQAQLQGLAPSSVPDATLTASITSWSTQAQNDVNQVNSLLQQTQGLNQGGGGGGGKELLSLAWGGEFKAKAAYNNGVVFRYVKTNQSQTVMGVAIDKIDRLVDERIVKAKSEAKK